MKTVRVAILMRGSTNKQTNKGRAKKLAKSGKKSARPITIDDDLPLQKEKIMELINSQPEANKGIRWELTEFEYVEAGVSAFHTHTSKRKGLNDAFNNAKAGLFDLLVVYKLDRLGRRSVESLNYAIKLLKYCRIWVVDKNREFTNNGDTDEIMNFIEFWSAKKSSVDTKTRITDIMKIIHNQGFWTGGNPPFGFLNHPNITNMLQQVPQEAEIVKEIYRMYTSEGYGMLKIAGILNEQGKKTKTGREWKTENIRKILRNSIYKGCLSYGKTETTEGEFGSYQKYTKEGEENISKKYWKEYDIVGEEIWEKAQKIKKSRVKQNNLFGGKTPSRSGTGKGLLVGLLKCECGSNMTYSTSSDWLDHKRTKKGEPYGIYRCLKRQKAGVHACGAKKATYRADKLEQDIFEKVKKYMYKMINSNVIDDIVKNTLQASKDISSKLEIAKQDVERWNKIKENANIELMKMLTGEKTDYSKSQITELYDKAIEELKKATNLYNELETVKKSECVNEVDILKLKDVLNDFEKIYEYATHEEKKQMMRSVIDSIDLKGEKVSVEINFDIIKYFEVISSIKMTGTTNETCLQYDDSRCTNCCDITSVINMIKSIDNPSFIKKLNRTFIKTINSNIEFSA